jgi:hypothetical protein
MKTKPLVLVAFYTVMLLHVSHCIGQNTAVFYGANTNSIGVAFVDANLSPSARASIVADMQVCLQEWGKRTQFRLGADDPAFVAHLYNPKRCPHYPEGTVFPDDVINGPNGLALQIPKKLSDAYTNAFAFAAANSNAVAAAYEFVAFVSPSNLVTLSTNALPNYIMFKNALADPNAESNVIVSLAPQIIPDLCEQTYHPPSILGFYYSGKGPSTTNLWMQVPTSSPSAGGFTDWNGTTVLWHDGKWKFCVWEDWVP